MKTRNKTMSNPAMDRRDFLKKAGSFPRPNTFQPMHALKLFILATFVASAVANAQPNIIYFLTDDLGYGDVQCLNPKRGKIPTPNMDKLAGQGMVFTDAHGSSSVCTPSRYSILTGRYNWRSRLQKGILHIDGTPLIAADRLTLPAMLKVQGYQTAGMGKWHLGMDLPLKGDDLQIDQPILNGPVTQGFDYYFCSDYRFFAPFMFVENDRFVCQPLL
jgi:arylsulfatase A-like enzyme